MTWILESQEKYGYGATVGAGYWQDPTATAQNMVEGWFRTGDYGYLDDNGYLTIVDRIKDLIIVSGFNVPAVEVESCIAELAPVQRVSRCGAA